MIFFYVFKQKKKTRSLGFFFFLFAKHFPRGQKSKTSFLKKKKKLKNKTKNRVFFPKSIKTLKNCQMLVKYKVLLVFFEFLYFVKKHIFLFVKKKKNEKSWIFFFFLAKHFPRGQKSANKNLFTLPSL